jgi:hypothetical protein
LKYGRGLSMDMVEGEGEGADLPWCEESIIQLSL